jgi:hypothetical protein
MDTVVFAHDAGFRGWVLEAISCPSWSARTSLRSGMPPFLLQKNMFDFVSEMLGDESSDETDAHPSQVVAVSVCLRKSYLSTFFFLHEIVRLRLATMKAGLESSSPNRRRNVLSAKHLMPAAAMQLNPCVGRESPSQKGVLNMLIFFAQLKCLWRV